MKRFVFVLLVLFFVSTVFLISGCETQGEPQHNKIYAEEEDYCATCVCDGNPECQQGCRKCALFGGE